MTSSKLIGLMRPEAKPAADFGMAAAKADMALAQAKSAVRAWIDIAQPRAKNTPLFYLNAERVAAELFAGTGIMRHRRVASAPLTFVGLTKAMER